jgi:tripartite-type tricarboxylate transporter receptor subunit TctC
MKFLPLSFLATLLAAGTSLAADYPNRPIRMIVTNAPGSSVYTLTRIVSVRLGALLGQQVVVDNRPGAASVVGMEIAKNANPDGYTLISAPTASLSVAPLLYKKLPYDTLNDFAYISLFAITPNVLVVTPALPVKSVKDLIDYSKTKQGQLNMASSGNGLQSHLTSALLASLGKFDALHVPYKSGGASVAAIIAGESQWMMTSAPAVWGLVKGGRLRAVAHSMTARTPLLGDAADCGDGARLRLQRLERLACAARHAAISAGESARCVSEVDGNARGARCHGGTGRGDFHQYAGGIPPVGQKRS